jgi:peptidoglycan pentaglycine glycine transferase (the first glycine)
MELLSFPIRWNQVISGLPNPHFLQSYEWARVKAQYGWQPLYALWDRDGEMQIVSDGATPAPQVTQAAALILRKSVRIGGMAAPLHVFYAPKGPNLDWADEALYQKVLADLEEFARRNKAIFLKIDPDVVMGTGVPGTESERRDLVGQAMQARLDGRDWSYSAEQIQFRNTVLLDLTASEDDLLSRMKQKTRYNIRLAEKKGVTVRAGTDADFPLLYRMYAETSVRDGFAIRDEGYYQTVWRTFTSSTEPGCLPLIAEVESEPVAAIFVFLFAKRAYYVYGMSRDAHREKMPNYLLQWEAMRRSRAAGCAIYDLWGAPDEFTEGDSMWGVFRFKEGLGGEVVRTLGAWDFAPNRSMYRLYTEIMPRILDVMRSRGKARTRHEVT